MTDSDLPPAVRQEVDRQVDAIMRGTAFGDSETRRTMQAELRDRLASALQNDKPLRVYLGVDPTAPDLHLGHCVSLRKLKLFQELGHHAILLIGDFTGLIGDPSDKNAARPMQAEAILAANARTYQEQAFKLLDPDATEVRRNSEWLKDLNFADVIGLASHFTVAQFIERDTFRQRLDKGEPVYIHEFMYGLMQGYDAVALDTDIQIGGTD
ncbi:MAG: tyrosine--tRNA ligase, partial [Chloroflexi bacterium]|nr:tyrosine--tRNA ligase [Chloroflexota bacterium]